MRAILITPQTHTVAVIDTDASLDSLQALVGGNVQYVDLGQVSSDYRGHHGLLNEYARITDHTVQDCWFLRGWPEDHLVGPMVILGDTDTGDEGPCTISLAKMAERVGFTLSVEEAGARLRGESIS